MLLANASASSVTPRIRVAVHEVLATEHEVTLAETSRRGHATKLAQGAAFDGYDAVIVLGGDGTVNEAANGLAGTSTALGLLPGGSTNVFARTIGFTNDPVRAVDELRAALRNPEQSFRRIGLGSANGRYYLFHCGMGFDAAVVRQVERRGSLKRYAGHPLFVYAALATWFRHYDRSRPHFDLVLGSGAGPPVEGVYLALALKTNPYTFLADRPLDVAPEAGLNTGLSVIAFQTLALRAVLGVVVATLTNRGGPRLGRRRNVAYAGGVTELTARSVAPFPYQLDGDYLGEVTELELRYQPDVLDLIVALPSS
jgi:diacylglycerol kinase family enzyme